MNFLDAHIIVHDRYAKALSNPHYNNVLAFRAYSDYGDDFNKQTILNAFKLFYAHVFLFNTRTQQEFEQYQASLCFLDSFIPDNELIHIQKAVKIVSGKGFFHNLFNSSAKEFATREIARYSSIVSPPYSWSNEMDTFITSMLEYKTQWFAEYKSLNDKKYFWDYIKRYCDFAYKTANIIEPEKADVFFAPFEQLRRDVIESSFKELLAPYADYIMSTR